VADERTTKEIKAMATIEVGLKSIPEEIIVSVEKQDDGNFIVSYDYDGDVREATTFNPFDRDDVRDLLKRRPDLEKKADVIESTAVVSEESEEIPVEAEEVSIAAIEAPVESPTVAINVQGERFFLAISRTQSHDAFDQCWREKFRAHRFKKGTALPTTEEVMIWNLKQCNARKQEDGSWSLPPRVTLDILEDILYFDVVSIRPVAPSVDPLIAAHEHHEKHASIY
jgi:hypothetical protein